MSKLEAVKKRISLFGSFLLCYLTHFDWTFGEKRSKYTIANRQFSDIQRNQMVMFNYRHLRNKWCSKDGEIRYIDNCQTKLLLFLEASVSDHNRRNSCSGLHKKYGKHIMNGRYTECITAAVTTRRLQHRKTRRHRQQVGICRRHRPGRSGGGLLPDPRCTDARRAHHAL